MASLDNRKMCKSKSWKSLKTGLSNRHRYLSWTWTST